MLTFMLTFALAAPALAPGAHRCGVQWSAYSELCTVTVDGDRVSIRSDGPSARFEGELKAIDANNFELDGKLDVTSTPIAYTDLKMCPEPGPYRFRHTGKRKFFRHTTTCKDMTTTYFDIFVEVVEPASVELTKRLSAMTGKKVFDSRKHACGDVTTALAEEWGDPSCLRFNDSGDNYRYYACSAASPKVPQAERLYVVDKAAECDAITQRLR